MTCYFSFYLSFSASRESGYCSWLVMRLWAGRLGNHGSFPGRDKIFFSSASRLALKHTKLSLSLGVEWPGLEAEPPLMCCSLKYTGLWPSMSYVGLRLVAWWKLKCPC
jgi:hypothetical protein